MKIFYGTAIQGEQQRGERAIFHQELLTTIKTYGKPVSEHVTGRTLQEARTILEKEFGKAPEEEFARRTWARTNMIKALEGNINAAIFEVSTPSLGTGIELAHAYLRPKMGFEEIPILALYQKDYWPNKLSSMIAGITKEEIQSFTLKEYTDLKEAKEHVKKFLKQQP
ncbi:hypothetical protein K8R43_06215 [archaeon]|nr:hypothetical protein [archaeon]